MFGTVWTPSANRAVLGLTVGGGTAADTAGLRIESVEGNGPAAKAGLEAGDVLTAINGVSLKVAREDAEDLALAGLAQRRLQRVLAKVHPSESVRLEFRRGGSLRTVSVTTRSAAELAQMSARPAAERLARASDARGRIGVTISTTGTRRDTLGLFIGAVVPGGPAELAGIVEGERVAAVNGVDVRVPREDLDDRQLHATRLARFLRTVEAVTPGNSVTLRVFGNGAYRDVTLKTVSPSALPGADLIFEIGDGLGRRQIRVFAPGARDFPSRIEQISPLLYRNWGRGAPDSAGTIRVIPPPFPSVL